MSESAKAQLRQYHGSLMLGNSDILVVGDSQIAGIGASIVGTIAGTRLVDVLRQQIRAKYQPAGIVGGEGYIPSHQPSGTDRWTLTGGSNLDIYGIGLRARLLQNSGNSLSISVVGTDIDIFWAGSPIVDMFSWAIDGGAATNVDTTLPAYEGGRVTSITGLSAGSHTLLISRVSGVSVIEGIHVYNGDKTSGIRMWEGGKAGATSATYINLVSQAGAEWLDSVQRIDPDLILINLITNDYRNGVAIATFTANVTELLLELRAHCTYPPSIVFLIPPKRTDAFTPAIDWSLYVQALYDVADDDGLCTVFSVDERFFTGALAPSATGVGLIGGDLIHPTDKGYAYWAHALASFLEV